MSTSTGPIAFPVRMASAVIRVKSLRPWWDERYRCVAWPTLLVDDERGGRATVTPLWMRLSFP
jgi:hypothetical protein